jgi:hypothetical protein
VSQTSHDARAVVRALNDLTTQVQRIADTQATRVVRVGDGVTTTPDDAVRVPCPDCSGAPLFRPDEITDHIVQQHTGEQQAPAADEDALRTTRRESARIILDRATRGVALRSDESALLRQHFDAETREHDTARAEAKRQERMGLSAIRACKKLLERRTTTLRRRAESAETELRTLRTGLRANGADPTQIQNLWAQIRLRNRQWRDAKHERDVIAVDLDTANRLRDEAQAAIERVRGYLADIERAGWSQAAIARRVRAALDGTEQPTTEE